MKQRLTSIGIALVALVLLLPVAASAQSPWQWQQSLKVEQVGDSMYMPSAVAFDAAGERYYVVDTGRNRLVSFDREGRIIRAFTADDQLRSPFDMVRLTSGQLWVVEKGGNSLTLIDPAARLLETHQLLDGSRRVFPDRIAVQGQQLFVLDRAGGEVLRLGADLKVVQRFSCNSCNGGISDFVLAEDGLLALAGRDRKLLRFAADGSLQRTMELGPEVDFAVSVAIGPSGFIYVLDRHQNSVLVYDEAGRFRYRFLTTGHSTGRLYFARQVRFDPWGNLCVVDEGNGRVEIFSR
ncbi:hypothetical protein [Pelovirga terrestris]|uniref:6-bladed beta-propeller n=1 Tax=Pelovirga terrestris TaxID=2771352 RepID=A0A8J6R683_9BACT|nr:hypothetical protein [Pelovirga terrestris]MBD1401094.1 hypothetical protein [Pelovirga terrestris]